MDCQQLLRTLNEYVDGDVDPSVCEEFEQHLAECRPCQVVVDTVRKTITLYKGEQVHEMPIRFKQKLHDELRRRWTRRDSNR